MPQQLDPVRSFVRLFLRVRDTFSVNGRSLSLQLEKKSPGVGMGIGRVSHRRPRRARMSPGRTAIEVSR